MTTTHTENPSPDTPLPAGAVEAYEWEGVEATHTVTLSGARGPFTGTFNEPVAESRVSVLVLRRRALGQGPRRAIGMRTIRLEVRQTRLATSTRSAAFPAAFSAATAPLSLPA